MWISAMGTVFANSTDVGSSACVSPSAGAMLAIANAINLISDVVIKILTQVDESQKRVSIFFRTGLSAV